MVFPSPAPDNGFLGDHVQLLAASFHQLTGRSLLDTSPPEDRWGEVLFHAPFGLLSHGTEGDPIFNYANQTALDLFELTWEQLIVLPSRYSAEAVNREERTKLLQQVSDRGYIADYRGVRISRTGKRFWIEKAWVWNLYDRQSLPYGQAAIFHHWTYL